MSERVRLMCVGGPSAGIEVEMDRGRRNIHLYDPIELPSLTDADLDAQISKVRGATLYEVQYHTWKDKGTIEWLAPAGTHPFYALEELLHYYRRTVRRA